ncbi:Plasma membrane permease, mediates uptake of glycerophosphoinositol and glycerophosphocholine [Neonectria magnoliae]|uniref:Plasma membrane permease, mediates uptake of glycerophosphoinositol and glycerophosphocholine n=1 Tax=Neonectria magnoliae TaxID=2732573 RepID=A0ABR1I3W1_9HYPO
MEVLGTAGSVDASVDALVDANNQLLRTAKRMGDELRDPPNGPVRIEGELKVINQLLLQVRDVGEAQSHHVLQELDELMRSLLHMHRTQHSFGHTEGFLHDFGELFDPRNNVSLFLTSRSTLSNHDFFENFLLLEMRTPDENICRYNKDEDGGFKASFDRSWSYIIHRDVNPANGTIQRTSKLENDLLDKAAFEDFMKLAKEEDESDRMSSLSIMQEAYRVLRSSTRIGELPSSVVGEMKAADSSLSCQRGGYLMQAFKSVAELLDDSLPFAGELSKKHRVQTVTRLRLLLEDGAKDAFDEHPYEYLAHLLVLLGKHQELDKLLSNESTDPNIGWKQSGWTPLHLAVQEGSQESVNSLLRRGAHNNMPDVHGRLPGEYAKEAGFEEMATQLGVTSVGDNAKLTVAVRAFWSKREFHGAVMVKLRTN